MRMNYSKKLKEFEEYLKKMQEIVGILYTGSTAKQNWDKYSDLDIDIVLKDKDYKRILKKLPKLFKWWGEIKFINQYSGCDETYAYIGNNYLKIDIAPIKKSQLKPCWEVKHIKIDFDKTGKLREVYKKSQKLKKEKINHKEIINRLLEQRDWQFYIARHFMRGQKFSAFNEIPEAKSRLLKLLAKIKGLHDYELVRTAESNLTKKEEQMLEKINIKSKTKTELRKAMKANWNFMKYIEKLYEKNYRKLNLKVNDKEILIKINEIFQGR